MSMRVAFVSDAIYPYNKGGKETRLHEISTRLAARGFDVHIYCMKWWPGPAEKTEEGVHLHGICPLIPLYSGERRSIKQGIMFGLACFRLLGAKFDVIDVDHMPFFPLYSVRVVCWLKGKKMFATWHEVWGMKYWREYLGGNKGRLAAIIESLSVKLPDTIIAVSPMTAHRLKNWMNYSGELVIVPNGIDLSVIKSAPKSDFSSDVIYAGRLLAHKNVEVLIQAIAVVKKSRPSIKLLIVGEGPEQKSLETLVTRLELNANVTFKPFEKDIAKLYGLIKSSKVFVLLSSREGFGLVVLEANACGLPVITVNEPDNAAKELVNGSNGRISRLLVSDVAKNIIEVTQNMPFSSVRFGTISDWTNVSFQCESLYKTY